MVAVIRTGGRQHRVQVGEIVRVDTLPGKAGDAIVFDRVLAVQDGESVRFGTPTVEGARVRGTVVGQNRDKKLLVFTYKRRKNSNRRLNGHRQRYTSVRIDSIEG